MILSEEDLSKYQKVLHPSLHQSFQKKENGSIYQPLFQKFVQQNQISPSQAQMKNLLNDSNLLQKFIVFLFIFSKARMIHNSGIQQTYFSEYLKEGREKAIKHLAEKANFEFDFKKEESPSVFLIDQINFNDASTTGDSDSGSEQESELQSQQVVVSRSSKGNQVKKVQALMKKLKLLPENAEIDGNYTPELEKAIRKFQKENQIKENGVVGQETFKKLFQGQQQQKQQKSSQNQLGGVNLDIKKLPKICGILVDKLTSQVQFLENSSQISQLSLENLAIGLKVYYDNEIKMKNISFSLDPYEATKPDGPFMRKVLYPDTLEKKIILAGTKFSEILFEADYLLKKLSLGVEEDSKSKFVYPEQLVKKGLKSIAQISQQQQKKPSDDKKQNWCRLWFVCEKVDLKHSKNYLRVGNVKIGVQAKQMTTDSQGRLKDSVTQDTNDPSFQFAQKMTQLFEDLKQFYPCLKQMEELYKAIALAKWIAVNRIAIDLKLVNRLLEAQKVANYSDKVKSIKQVEEKEIFSEEKIEVDIRTIAIRSLQKQELEVSEKNIDLAIKSIQKQSPGEKFYDIKRYKQVQFKGVLGGVDMNIDLETTKNSQKKQLQQNKKDKSNDSVSSSFCSDNSTQVSKAEELEAEEEEKEIQKMNKIPFFFTPQETCKVCQTNLGMQELKFPVENEFFCQIHHPFSCFYCSGLVEQGQKIKGTKQIYDSPEFIDKEVYFHSDCLHVFQLQAQDRHVKNHYSELVAKQTAEIIKHIQQVKKGTTDLKQAQMKNKTKFVCSLCKAISVSQNVFCHSCGKADESRVNVYLKEQVEILQKQQMSK